MLLVDVDLTDVD